jgi:polysaccharide biosynthesis transport protein
MELRDVARLSWKRRWVVLGVLAACLALSAAFLVTQTKLYESTATLALTPNTEGQSFTITPDALSALLGTYAETSKSRLLRNRAASQLGRPLGGSISTDTVAGTGILRISARSPDPQHAAQNASAMATAFRQSIAGNSVIVATLVDTPVPGESPVQPRVKLTLVVAFILGLFGGVLLAFALEQFRRRITTTSDIAELTPAPVIGRLPRDRRVTRDRLHIVWDDPTATALQESFRALRTNLQFIFPATTGVLQVTSSEQGEGKSTISANLAIAFGQIGIDTVLVDADLRRPRQHELFGLSNRYGLSTLLKRELEQLPLLPSGYENLRVLPSGPLPPDPTELLSIRVAGVLRILRDLDTLLIVDSPPILPVSDARLIAPHTDGIVMVVAAGAQRPARLQLALERLSLAEAPLLGVVLNKGGADVGDLVAGYGYGYGYGSGGEPPPDRLRTAKT